MFVTHHIREAVWLSDRVIVLSDRPGEIDTVVDIDLPRPRRPETRKREEFHDYENHLTDKLFGHD